MSEVTKSLRSIAKGTLLSSLGIFLALFLSFLQRWAIIRVVTPEEYGLYSLSLAVIAVFLSVGSLGLTDGIARVISAHSSVKSHVSRKSVFSSLIFLSSVSGGSCLLLLMVGSPCFSSFFGKDITWIVRVLSISLPFNLLLDFLISFFRGIERAEVKVLFNDFLRNFVFLFALVAIFLRKMPFHSIIIGYVISFVISALAVSLYTVCKVGSPEAKRTLPFAEEMILFSLPLLGGSLFQLVTAWADTLLLGVFRSSSEIALYNAALPTSKLIQAFLGALIFIYMPVATSLFSRGLLLEMKKVYVIVSKWVLFLTVPLFVVLFCNAETLFQFLYGHKYLEAVLPFRIIAAGYLLHIAFGPNGGALIAMGKTRVMMVTIAVTALTNLAANLFLIPRLGMEGAAISMLITLIVAAMARGSALYRLSGIHPLERNYVKSLLISFPVILGCQAVLERIAALEAWMLPILLVMYTVLYGFCMILARSVDQEDIWMLMTVEKKLGVEFVLLKSFLKRFMK
ncbi:MAG: flippase [Theionarchaea archaeon]|nr:flippase [Theionarchaea archaeon]MBU7000287.1 flippase [Theionarchaea archaeon]MBU7020729.1 flippase [Theionarchaea archaeon]